MSYTLEVYNSICEKNKGEDTFHQAVKEVFLSIEPFVNKNEKLYKDVALLEKLTEPDRIISFKVPWTSDSGKVFVNKGYRVQFSNAIGPYKGGLRFHPSVNQGLLKFLGFEQIFKNSLTGLPMGGAKGGSDFDPKGKSENEIMRFCQSFMNELYKYIGKDMDVPAGDIGVGAREIGYLFGQYKRLTGLYEGVLTGKGLSYGGSLARKEATGFGVCYMAEDILNDNSDSVKDKVVSITGSGNVAIYAAVKFIEKGAKVITLSDSNGYIVDEDGIKIDIIKEIKEVKRGRIKDYILSVKNAKYFDGALNGKVPCDIYAPCATQNELDDEGSKNLINNGLKLLVEGANMPSNMDAINNIRNSKVLYMPGKAANAGGVSVSGLEMSQNSLRFSWSFEEVDKKLQDIMKGIYNKVKETKEEFGGDYMQGANIAGFKKVAEAVIAQGV